MDPNPWHTDSRMLAAGNARGIDGGDPDAMPISPAGPRAITANHLAELTGRRARPDDAAPSPALAQAIASRRTGRVRTVRRPSAFAMLVERLRGRGRRA